MAIKDNYSLWLWGVAVGLVSVAIISGTQDNEVKNTTAPTTYPMSADVKYINQTPHIQSNIVRIKDGCRVLYVTNVEIHESDTRKYLTLGNHAQISVSDRECLKDTKDAE